MATRTVAKRTVNAVLNRLLSKESSFLAPQLSPALLRSTPQRSIIQPVWAAAERPASIRWFSDSKSATTAATEEEPSSKQEEESKVQDDNNEATALDGDAAAAAAAGAAAQLPSNREDELTAQVKELKDALMRSLAEQENTRRIAQRDVEQARQFAIKSFAKSLLDVSDNLERAMAAVPTDINKEEHPVLANLYEGIELTERGLIKAFELNGLVKFGAIGELFDPNRHEALFEYSDPAQTPGTVGQVMKPGFLLNKRVLRPAEVGVIKKQE